MHENRMEKLLNLLNQYDDEEGKDLYEWEIEWEDIIWYNRFWWWYETIDVSRSVIISKRYWFIERLVKKDKIDIDAYKTVFSWDLDKRKNLTRQIWWEEFYQVVEHWAYESLLMLLSIQEEPVSFLISLLK